MKYKLYWIGALFVILIKSPLKKRGIAFCKKRSLKGLFKSIFLEKFVFQSKIFRMKNVHRIS
ncbi:hypothetical protein AR546_06690 [Leptospira interrogans serovar Canicola]|nr:hypothetical protein LEP1GSC069_0109 [Leptospira interrogans serovar Canicola str. Fiocruz LV133]EMK15437.1 hypothetical protein LEP1GSC075_0496 [Leptospira interrogans str. Kito]EMN74203.1 hypothetical protein LEP1GSC102_4415 [Leptospira interrogans str. UI 09600]MCR8626986.1 hypothetical protein [Leptospira interrogans serovar Canicola]OQM33939.1 hypothetical protein DV30_00210 [Leptospira interrogans serovar Canicola str. Gui44]